MSDSFIVYPQPGEEPIEVPRVDPEAEGARLRSFLKQALHAEQPPQLGEGQIVVQPGGRSFRTIREAIDSVNPDANNRYAIYLGPGTYRERVYMKPYLSIIGSLNAASEPVSIITQTGRPPEDRGTLLGSDHGVLSNLHIISDGSNGLAATAVAVLNASLFGISNCRMAAPLGDKSNAGIALGVSSVMKPSSTANVFVSNSDIAATAANQNAWPVGVACAWGSFLELDNVNVVAENTAGSSSAAYVRLQGRLQCNVSKLRGGTWSLQMGDSGSITARHCTLSGAVDSRAKVIP